VFDERRKQLTVQSIIRKSFEEFKLWAIARQGVGDLQLITGEYALVYFFMPVAFASESNEFFVKLHFFLL
jgi:hypothetical protein